MFLVSLIKKIIFKIRLFLFRFSPRHDAVFYINGPDTLPKPLTPDEEQRAIDMLDDVNVRAFLVEHNLRLVVYIAKKFENTGTGIEDLISIGTIGLIKAINTYRADKNIKLATYASRCIENEILMYIRKVCSHRGDMSIDEPLNGDIEGNELLLSDILGSDGDEIYRNIESEEERRVVRDAVTRLSSRERLIVSLRFGLDGGGERTQKDVADMLGISQSYISRLEKKIMLELRKQIGTRI